MTRQRSHRRGRLIGAAVIAALTVTGPVPTSAASRPAAPPPAVTESVTATPGDAYNYSPTSRTLAPVAIHRTTGSVTDPSNVLSGLPTRIGGNDSSLTVDFGKEVGGLVTLHFAAASGAGQSVGLTFSESSTYAGLSGDRSTGRGWGGEPGDLDGVLYTSVGGETTYTTPAAQLRGGFRYLTIFVHTAGWVDLDRISLQFTAAPEMAIPAAYANYFLSNDTLLNRIWYAGAYTVQMNTISSNQGRVWPPPASGWRNDAVVSVGTSVLTDGAKRDRTIWPGDLGISVPTAYVSTGDTVSTRNALSTLYNHQLASGELPYAGPEVNFYGSDTYHLWTLIVTATYYQYTADKSWLDGIWSRYKSGMAFAAGKIGANGLFRVTGYADWLRGGQGGENIAANALAYRALIGGARLARVEGDPGLAATYEQRAERLKGAVNERLWDAGAGQYRDNPDSSLHPQDGNSLAIWYGLVDTPARALRISRAMGANWNAFGARTPEWGNNIGTFPGSMAVHAHFAARDEQRGVDLIRRQWGYMLDHPASTNSTFWEGFNADGSFAYQGNLMSHAHGWATGPTSALTFWVLGIAPDDVNGRFRFVPHPADLTHVEGRQSTPQGMITASWDRNAAAGTFTQRIGIPAGATGEIGVPTFGRAVAVSVNGVRVWDGQTGSAYAAQSDGQYIYLRSVPGGNYTIESTTVAAAGPAGYNFCAVEGATCSFTGTRTVGYGANGSFVFRTLTGGTACTTAVFGDPSPGTPKTCHVTPTFTACAAENGSCSFTGTRRVAYGAEGVYRIRTVTGGTACTNAVFGDPIYGVVKNCYVEAAGGGSPLHGYATCATENAYCGFSGVQSVAFGANDVFNVKALTGGTTCTNGVFGDPIFGVVKSCHLALARDGLPTT